MLEVRSVLKRFGGATVVDDASLSVAAGGIVGLIGPNGAGKTTLFNLIAGSIAPTSGKIFLNGAEINAERPHRRIKRGLGRTFQIPRPFSEMTILDNMLTAAQAQSGERMFATWFMPGRVAREERINTNKAMAWLEFLGLARLAQEPARVLSGGQRKLLELGRVLMADPRVILLDDPVHGQARVRGKLRIALAPDRDHASFDLQFAGRMRMIRNCWRKSASRRRYRPLRSTRAPMASWRGDAASTSRGR